jgi:L-fuconate dehydratase
VRHAVEQREQLCDVVAVAAGERPGQGDAAAVYEEMLLATAPASVDRAGARLRAPFFACT